ncbi:MAG: type II CAAX endopeptidase family protein [Urechidicola sp.]|nr:type II CAAX endopeptidase family protein [Urechidicola sp.]
MNSNAKTWERILFIILPYFIVVGVFQLFGIIFSGVAWGKLDSLTATQLLIISFFSFLGTSIVLWVFMKNVDEEKFIKLGFDFNDRSKDIFLGIFIGAVIISSCFFSMIVLDEISFQYTDLNNSELIITIVAFFIVSVTEEMFFRGYILRNLMSSLNKYFALAISSIIFTLFHALNPNIDWVSLFTIFLAGFLLGISYSYTKNLWFSIALHFSWNLFQSLFGFNVSGQDFYSLIEVNIKNNSLINGGAFGIEGSLLSILMQVLFIFVISFYFKKKTLANIKQQH